MESGIINLHDLARNIHFGPNYRGLIACKRNVGEGGVKYDMIVLTIPFRFSPDNPDFIETVFEELSTGIYLPQSDVTKGLTKKGPAEATDEPNTI